MLSFEQIKELIELIAERRLQGLEIERAGFRLKIDGQAPPVAAASRRRGPPPRRPATARPAPGARRARPLRRLSASGAGAGLGPARAPTSSSRRSSAPSTARPRRTPIPSSSVGSRVRKGQVLCIIEAMKLMNEIESDVDGEVVEIYPQNGQPVEFGEPLFAIRTD